MGRVLGLISSHAINTPAPTVGHKIAAVQDIVNGAIATSVA
jgi:hypothetical protein